MCWVKESGTSTARASGNEGFAFLVPAAPGFFATFTVKSLLCTKPAALQLPVKCFRVPAARTDFPWHWFQHLIPFPLNNREACADPSCLCTQDVQMQNKASKSFQPCH